MPGEHERWLNLTIEDPIDPALPICDAHHHLWDHPDDRYFLDDFLQDIGGGHNIVQTVYIECGFMYRQAGPEAMRPVGETEFVQGIAARSAAGQYGKTAIAAGIVGFADLTLGAAVAPVLEAHLAAGRNRLRGIRHVANWDADVKTGKRALHKVKGLLLDQAFREGFARLQKHGLSFDAWVFHTQLEELADLAGAFPDTPIIVEHAGGFLGVGPYAGKREKVFREWKRGMTLLAACPNVVVKLGGFGMPGCGFGWHERPRPPTSAELAQAIAPYYRSCIELFGAERCMFEGNFPTDKVSYPYTVVWNAFKRLTKDCSAAERSALFHDTAAKVYRLAPR